MEQKAVVLLSGGLDSTTTLAIAQDQGFSLYALTFRYGLRHEYEIRAAQRVAGVFGVAEHGLVEIDLRSFGGSALTGEIAVPKDRPFQPEAGTVPPTYVPARNTIFLSFALAWAEVLDAVDIFIGVNAIDYSGYPDCRPAYIEAFTRMANLATRAATEENCRISIHTPLLNLSKSQIIQKGKAMGVDYAITHSCYDPLADGIPCGHCDACRLRLKGFGEAGLSDPLPYPADA